MNYLLYLALVALVIWIILKVVGVAISSTLFWTILVVLLLVALVGGLGRGRYF